MCDTNFALIFTFFDHAQSDYVLELHGPRIMNCPLFPPCSPKGFILKINLSNCGQMWHMMSLLEHPLFLMVTAFCYPWYCKEHVRWFCVGLQLNHLFHQAEKGSDIVCLPVSFHSLSLSLIHALKYLLSHIIVVLQLSLVNLNRTSVTVNSMDKKACDMWNQII